MEFTHIGAQCAFCRQQDFLPFTCEHCSEKFCKEHSHVTSHQCTKYKDPTSSTQKSNEIHTGVLKTCAHKKCDHIQISICNKCNKGHCIDHRTFEDHQCKGIGIQNKHLLTYDLEIQKRIENEVKTQKLRKDLGYTQNYTNKQEIKKRIKGEPIQFCNTIQTVWGQSSIDEQDRFYLKVFFPIEANLQPAFWFFNRSKVVGKVLDMIAEKGEVSNKILPLDDPTRLNLYKLQTSESVKQLGKPLGDVFKNGDFVVLERGSNGGNLSKKFYDNLLSHVDNVDMWKRFIPSNQTIKVQ
jgi:hypothetical protein